MREVLSVTPNEYNLAHISNSVLLDYTDKIMGSIVRIKNYQFAVCKLLAEIQNKALYKDDFCNFSEYGQKVFGYNKSQLYALASIGNRFIDKDYNSLLNDTFTVTQMMLLLPYNNDEINEMYEHEIITSEMNTKEFKTAVNDYKSIKKGNKSANLEEYRKRKNDYRFILRLPANAICELGNNCIKVKNIKDDDFMTITVNDTMYHENFKHFENALFNGTGIARLN